MSDDTQISNTIFIRANRWCLKPKALVDLVQNSKSLNSKAVSTKGPAESLILKSNLADKVFYEVIAVNATTPNSEVYINLWVEEGGRRIRTCVYAEGMVLKWGIWTAELLAMLPGAMIRAIEAKAKTRTGGCESEEAFVKAEIALTMGSGDAFSESVVDDIFRINRSGLPYDQLG